MLYEIFSINFIKCPYIYSSTGDCNESSGSQYLYTNNHVNFDTIKQPLVSLKIFFVHAKIVSHISQFVNYQELH